MGIFLSPQKIIQKFTFAVCNIQNAINCPCVIIIISNMSTTQSSVPVDQRQRKTASTSQKKQKSSSSQLLVNILLLIAISCVVYASQIYKDTLQQTKQILQKQTTIPTPSQQPIRAQKERRNVMCPQAKSDYESCMQKLTRCRKTQGQFEDAQKQFTKLISDCARSNQENQRVNDQMEKEIQKMEEDLNKAENM